MGHPRNATYRHIRKTDRIRHRKHQYFVPVRRLTVTRISARFSIPGICAAVSTGSTPANFHRPQHAVTKHPCFHRDAFQAVNNTSPSKSAVNRILLPHRSITAVDCLTTTQIHGNVSSSASLFSTKPIFAWASRPKVLNDLEGTEIWAA